MGPDEPSPNAPQRDMNNANIAIELYSLHHKKRYIVDAKFLSSIIGDIPQWFIDDLENASFVAAGWSSHKIPVSSISDYDELLYIHNTLYDYLHKCS